MLCRIHNTAGEVSSRLIESHKAPFPVRTAIYKSTGYK
jgi:hypothetical protein